jgi:hypothetical protein
LDSAADSVPAFHQVGHGVSFVPSASGFLAVMNLTTSISRESGRATNREPESTLFAVNCKLAAGSVGDIEPDYALVEHRD